MLFSILFVSHYNRPGNDITSPGPALQRKTRVAFYLFIFIFVLINLHFFFPNRYRVDSWSWFQEQTKIYIYKCIFIPCLNERCRRWVHAKLFAFVWSRLLFSIIKCLPQDCENTFFFLFIHYPFFSYFILFNILYVYNIYMYLYINCARCQKLIDTVFRLRAFGRRISLSFIRVYLFLFLFSNRIPFRNTYW